MAVFGKNPMYQHHSQSNSDADFSYLFDSGGTTMVQSD